MSRPTHSLKHEHRVIEQAMRGLEGMCLRMTAGAVVPDEELSKLLDFIHGFADQFHHVKEETYLFPALEQIGIRNEDGPLAFLRNEHKIERTLLNELELAVEDFGRNKAAKEQFVSAALRFKDHLIGHVQQEESILFTLAEEMLDDRVKDSLAQAFQEENAENQANAQRYEQLAIELENRWAV